MSSRMARYLLSVAGAALAALAIGMMVGSAASSTVIAGLADTAAITRWGLPLAKLLADLAATATAGAVVVALLLPSDRGMVSPQGLSYVRAASWAALSWAIATAITLLLTVSDVLAVAPGQLPGTEALSFITSTPQGNALVLVMLFAISLALFARDVTPCVTAEPTSAATTTPRSWTGSSGGTWPPWSSPTT
ncbi:MULTISPECIES: hypothetical protein [unclassified Streptosporangium]|uniref:hypothetical protein n=1 Tax=unclassified Streptosporangium TaxID=2632669 RepID=UPI002E283897|nr:MULTISPECIES: hypothetical protein [unclassified Streptosporangium]